MKYSFNNPRPLPTIERLRELFDYNASTGVLTWRISTGAARTGTTAGTPNGSGYRQVQVDGSRYYAHRIAWKMHHREEPPAEIDHIDTNKSNNSAGNLRAACRPINTRNANMQHNNTSGVTGVVWHKQRGKWGVRVHANGKTSYGGLYSDIGDAVAKVCEMTEQLHGPEFGRINVREDLRHHVPERCRYLLRLENQL